MKSSFIAINEVHLFCLTLIQLIWYLHLHFVLDYSQDALGPEGIGGYQHVVALAEFLYGLLEREPRVINNADADKIVQLWEAMGEYDRSPTKFRANYKTQLVKGRFKAPKTTRTQLVPGVQSVRR